MRVKNTKKGEIASLLAIVSMAVMLLGVTVGSRIISKPQTLNTKASGLDREYYTYCNDVDRGDNPGSPGSLYAITNKGNSVSEPDTCGAGYITEWFCDGQKNPHSLTHVCNDCVAGSGGDHCNDGIGGLYKSPTPVPPSPTHTPNTNEGEIVVTTPVPSPTDEPRPTAVPPSPTSLPIGSGGVSVATPTPTIAGQNPGGINMPTPTPTVVSGDSGGGVVTPVISPTTRPAATPTIACLDDGTFTSEDPATRCCTGNWYAVSSRANYGFVCGYSPGSEPTPTIAPPQQFTMSVQAEHEGKVYNCSTYWKTRGSQVYDSGTGRAGAGNFECEGNSNTSVSHVAITLDETYSLGTNVTLHYSVCGVGGGNCSVQSTVTTYGVITSGGRVNCVWNFPSGSSPSCSVSNSAGSNVPSGILTATESEYYAMFDSDNNKVLSVNDWMGFIKNMPASCQGKVAVCASQLLSRLGYQLQQ